MDHAASMLEKNLSAQLDALREDAARKDTELETAHRKIADAERLRDEVNSQSTQQSNAALAQLDAMRKELADAARACDDAFAEKRKVELRLGEVMEEMEERRNVTRGKGEEVEQRDVEMKEMQQELEKKVEAEKMNNEKVEHIQAEMKKMKEEIEKQKGEVEQAKAEAATKVRERLELESKMKEKHKLLEEKEVEVSYHILLYLFCFLLLYKISSLNERVTKEIEAANEKVLDQEEQVSTPSKNKNQ